MLALQHVCLVCIAAGLIVAVRTTEDRTTDTGKAAAHRGVAPGIPSGNSYARGWRMGVGVYARS